MELTTLTPFEIYFSVFGIPLIQLGCLLYLIIKDQVSLWKNLVILFTMTMSSIYTVYFYHTLPHSELNLMVYIGLWLVVLLIPLKLHMNWKHHILFFIGYLFLFIYTIIQLFFFLEYYGFYYGLTGD